MRRLFALAPLVVVAACATPGPKDERPIEKCPVCAHYNDLGCVDVRVDAKTPRCTYCGTTYCFCSDRCRARFEKDPKKFLQQ